MERVLFNEDEKKKYFIKFNVDGLLRGDYQSRMSGYSVGIQNGFLSPNDVRELENMDLIPEELGGNRYLCNGNMIDIGSAGKRLLEDSNQKTENPLETEENETESDEDEKS